ncbi:MAG TPA: biopolymer transporter ExbD [Panacibacter sp.]|nr:biopolymer transporter ExbD [Panacibacter sp.]HNP43182.1 biopolymer transporter ExbD [Panacibacter sp.]
MAEIQSNDGPKKPGVHKSKKLSTRVDLTPMVDLGFLLITFFVFTTSITKPTAMKILMPADGGDSKTSAGKTINLLLAKDNIVFYYNGDSLNNIHQTDFSAIGLRAVINEKKKAVAAFYGNANETVVLIKPLEQSNYRNVVDALDEMQINQVNRYILMDAGKEELAMLETKR